MTPREKLLKDLRDLAVLYGTTWETVLSKNATRKVQRAREEIIFYVYENFYDRTKWSYVKIGKVFNRHHTAIRRSVAKAMARNGLSSHKLVKMEKQRYNKMRMRNKRKAMEDRVYG